MNATRNRRVISRFRADSVRFDREISADYFVRGNIYHRELGDTFWKVRM